MAAWTHLQVLAAHRVMPGITSHAEAQGSVLAVCFMTGNVGCSLRRCAAAACLSVPRGNQILYDVFYLTRDSAFHWTVTESQEAASILLVFEELSIMI